MNAYVWHLAQHEKWDRSGRRMADAVGGEDAPKRTYWLKVLKGMQAMTTQDVALIAAHFGVSPYDLIDTARAWDAAGRPGEGFLPDVVPHAEDFEQTPGDKPDNYGLAAKRGEPSK